MRCYNMHHHKEQCKFCDTFITPNCVMNYVFGATGIFVESIVEN